MLQQFTAQCQQAAVAKSDCLVVMLPNTKKLPSMTSTLNSALKGGLKALQKNRELGETLGDHILLHNPEGITAKRLLVINADKLQLTDREFLTLAEHMARHCTKVNSSIASVCLDDIEVTGRDLQWQARMVTEALIKACYRFEPYKSSNKSPCKLTKLTLITSDKSQLASLKKGLRIGRAIGGGAALARDLGNTPPNICNPVYLSKQAKAMARGQDNLKVTIIDEKTMAEMGMHSLLSVGRGSAQPSQLIVMEYQGGKKDEAPYALVGKGITFDSGGISLKPGAAMDEMKFDMCGAAAVFGALHSVLTLQLKINLVCVVAAAENMPSADASRPGDIVTSLSGKTIEILNTDAEGRLVLCDALTYVQRYQPKTIIDLATLTGAVIIALGREATGLMSNDDQFAQTLLAAGQQSGDRVWQLPLWPEYGKLLESPFADIANLGGIEAGTITAGYFLGEFTQGQTWAHLDIAGTAWVKGEHKGATGAPVGLLTEYLMHG
ncbi:leucyl aminopeptidase [Oceanicoccus sagamiensis]|uniref:Probable cytosol aminopeptidase n=1 Tax=Oceanicoccus sagamiensis TaxID=716816 RepID=A0A1X9NE02_9GAMM|nr:leucyl aminopeptidase [Oceanicoccus sagamiensis]ARN73769.1 leucyl aminopeptidase [Oceanicoccus sagamiensis]